MTENKELVFSYTFIFPNEQRKEFHIKVDPGTMNIIKSDRGSYPDWAKLENFKCAHCPLQEKFYDYCPVATNIVDILAEFNDMPSFKHAEVIVVTEQRTFTKKTSLQAGVSSLMGILMVSSGCPIMGKLKPMLHFHLPFASLEETQFRALSFYLLSQYVVWKRGFVPDWEMNDLVNIYEDIRVLNHNVSRKIANLEEMDTSINSLVILNNFADYVTFTIDEKVIEELEFYLKGFTE
jgi:hypothetical protein